MDTTTDMALQGASVPQASYHIEVSSADGATPPAEPLPPEPMASPPVTAGGARSVVLVRSGSDSASPAAEARSVKYVLTGLQTTCNGAGVGVTPVKSPAVATAGQTTSAARARQILKKRLDLSLAEKKYTRMLHPELAATEGNGSGEPQSAHTPVMICEPEAETAKKQGRTFFFVAKPPGKDAEEDQVALEPVTQTPQLPDDPAPSEAAAVTDLGVLKRLARYRLSEKYEILPAASLDDAEDIMHRLRMQNLMLKTELVRQATEYERHGDEYGLRTRRGRKKATTIVAVDRLRELEKIEAGMHTLFTPSQVKAFSRDYKKNSVQWRDEDFRRAIGLLEHSSQHTFNYVRKVMNIPLPSIGTLKLRCPQQPELHVRLEAALQERGSGEGRCKQCSRRMSSAVATAQGAAGDGAEEGDYQQVQAMSGEEQQIEWTAETPPPGILKRKKSRGGGASARKTIRQDEEVVFYEAPVAPPPRGRGRRSSSGGGGGGGGGSGSVGEAGRRGRPGLVGHYEHQPPPQEVVDDDEEDDDDDEPEDEDDFEEEFGEEVEGEVEIDPQQQEVPTQFAHFRTTYEGGWNEWDPRQLQ